MFKVSNRNTRTNCEIWSRFTRTALKHIRISQLLLGVQIGNLNMCFQTGLKLASYESICKSNIYIFHIFFWFYRDCPVRIICCIIQMPRCGMYSALAIKTTERRHSRRSGVFIVNFEHDWHLVLGFPFSTWNR